MSSVAASCSAVPSYPLSPEAEKAFRDICLDQDQPWKEDVVSKILQDRQSGWEGYFTPHPIDQNLCVQTHGIKGLKIYRDGHGELVADMALWNYHKEEHDNQGWRKQRAVCHICADGTVQRSVRYSSPFKWYSHEDPSYFSLFITRALAVSEKLGAISHLLPLSHTGSYVNRSGHRKDRYESPLCEGNLLNIDIAVSYPIQSLHIFLDALSALNEMHARGFIHRDFRAGTISFKGDQGFLSGLGFVGHINDPYFGHISTGGIHFAPSEAAILYDQRSNMFAVGVSLLRLYRKDLWDEFCDIQQRLWYYVRLLRDEGRPDWSAYIDEMEKLTCLPPPADGEGKEYWPQNIQALQQKLLQTNGSVPYISQLIAELIDADPSQRPTCAQTIERGEEVIKYLQEPQSYIDPR